MKVVSPAFVGTSHEVTQVQQTYLVRVVTSLGCLTE